MPEVIWKVPTWFKGNHRTQGQNVHRRPSAMQGIMWIKKPEGVQGSLDPARHYLIWVDVVPSWPSHLQGEHFTPRQG